MSGTFQRICELVQERKVRLSAHKLDPYLLANIQLSQISKQALRHDAGKAPAPLTPLAPLKDHRRLLDDAGFQNHVAAKYYLLMYYLQQTHELTGDLNELNAELDRPAGHAPKS